MEVFMCSASIFLNVYVFYKISHISLFIYLGFYVAFNTVQVISQWVVGGQRKPVHTVHQGSVL